MKITNYILNPPKIIATIILIIAWISGEVSGLLPWILLLALCEFEIKWKP